MRFGCSALLLPVQLQLHFKTLHALKSGDHFRIKITVLSASLGLVVMNYTWVKLPICIYSAK